MNSRELVIKTLGFDKPERIPRQLWTLPWAEERYPREIEKIRSNYPSDIVTALSFYKTQLPQIGSKFKKGVFIDEWGCTR
ncbi:MAG: methyltransferase, partial [Atribacterota bacterium]